MVVRLDNLTIDLIVDRLIERGFDQWLGPKVKIEERYLFSTRLLTKLADQVFRGLGPGRQLAMARSCAHYLASEVYGWTADQIAAWPVATRRYFYHLPGGESNLEFLLRRLVHAAWLDDGFLVLSPGRLVFLDSSLKLEIKIGSADNQWEVSCTTC